MDYSRIEPIVNATLYEGYILYPYRSSSIKNRQGFTFGRVYPRDYSLAQKGADPFLMQTQCLAEIGTCAKPRVELNIRFLQPTIRVVGKRIGSQADLPVEFSLNAESGTSGNFAPMFEEHFEDVPSLEVEGTIYQSWQEAVEREISLPPQELDLVAAETLSYPFSFPHSETLEPITDSSGRRVGVIRRTGLEIEGTIELVAERLQGNIVRITARLLNRTSAPEQVLGDSEAILMRSFASAHIVLQVHGGAFFSSIDPPSKHAETVSGCRNIGGWPVLVGNELTGDRDMILAAPIILYDYPEIAPESAGNFFDSAEIDEMLTLRVLTLTDEEKNMMRGANDFARQILQRTESLSEESMMKLHGIVRPTGEKSTKPESDRELEREWNEFFNTKRLIDGVLVDGVFLQPGDLVRICPRGGADIMDMALAGKVAVIEGVEQDIEDKIFLALVVRDDPGYEFGMSRQTGHRFFFSPDEIEPLQQNDL